MSSQNTVLVRVTVIDLATNKQAVQQRSFSRHELDKTTKLEMKEILYEGYIQAEVNLIKGNSHEANPMIRGD